MNLDSVKKLNIPKKPGIYHFKDVKGEIIYIGKAADLRSRVFSYWRDSANHSPAKYAMMKLITKIDWIETGSEIEALLLESNLIKKFQPQFNVMMRDDKRHVYIKISTEDEYPRLFLARRIDQAGKYFGPFVSTEAVRETLRALRKIWPYRSCRTLPKRACLYYSIGKCPGVCEQKLTKKEYGEIVKQITLFLEGKKKQVIKNYEIKIKNYEKQLKKDMDNNEIKGKISHMKYQLANMQNVLAHTNILGLIDKYASDVVELAKILSLPKVPERIEGYDISNIFGKDAVGSMVVFDGGEPDKNEYRKFKIRIGPAFAKAQAGKQGDVQMLREVLERRFKHNIVIPAHAGIQNVIASWALPDLIIIDGGKGQLNVALSVLKKAKLDIMVIAVSKGEGLRSSLAPDKIFFPGQKTALTLPLASPALHIIKRVRDEAHRFAIGYHKKLRKKAFFGQN